MQRGVAWVINNLEGVEYDYLLIEGDSQLIINFGTREYTPRSIPLYTAIDQVKSEAREARLKL